MSNLNESEYFVHLISSKLLKWPPNFVKNVILAELLIVKYRQQIISDTNIALHKWTPMLMYICVT